MSADNVFQQVSYVNAICTVKGGTHVEYVANQVIAKLLPVLKRKNKAEVCLFHFPIEAQNSHDLFDLSGMKRDTLF